MAIDPEALKQQQEAPDSEIAVTVPDDISALAGSKQLSTLENPSTEEIAALSDETEETAAPRRRRRRLALSIGGAAALAVGLVTFAFAKGSDGLSDKEQAIYQPESTTPLNPDRQSSNEDGESINAGDYWEAIFTGAEPDTTTLPSGADPEDYVITADQLVPLTGSTPQELTESFMAWLSYSIDHTDASQLSPILTEDFANSGYIEQLNDNANITAIKERRGSGHWTYGMKASLVPGSIDIADDSIDAASDTSITVRFNWTLAEVDNRAPDGRIFDEAEDPTDSEEASGSVTFVRDNTSDPFLVKEFITE